MKNYRIVSNGEVPHTVVLEVTDVLGSKHSLTVPYAGVVNHELGIGYIQDNFPDLTPDQRELLITGIPSGMWDKLFKDE